MPDYFSHAIAAEVIYKKLNIEYKRNISMTAYLLGAQGGDIFFTYNLTPRHNIGAHLHKLNAHYLFEKLSEGNLSYAAGYATHYALDTALHPKVYAYEKTRRSPLAHQSFESDLGLYFCRRYGIRRTIIPREKALECTGAIYDTIKKIEPQITMTGVERCLKRHFIWTRYYYFTKRQQYKCGYDFKLLDGDVDRAIDLGVKAVSCIFEGNIDYDVFGGRFLSKK